MKESYECEQSINRELKYKLIRTYLHIEHSITNPHRGEVNDA